MRTFTPFLRYSLAIAFSAGMLTTNAQDIPPCETNDLGKTKSFNENFYSHQNYAITLANSAVLIAQEDNYVEGINSINFANDDTDPDPTGSNSIIYLNLYNEVNGIARADNVILGYYNTMDRLASPNTTLIGCGNEAGSNDPNAISAPAPNPGGQNGYPTPLLPNMVREAEGICNACARSGIAPPTPNANSNIPSPGIFVANAAACSAGPGSNFSFGGGTSLSTVSFPPNCGTGNGVLNWQTIIVETGTILELDRPGIFKACSLIVQPGAEVKAKLNGQGCRPTVMVCYADIQGDLSHVHLFVNGAEFNGSQATSSIVVVGNGSGGTGLISLGEANNIEAIPGGWNPDCYDELENFIYGPTTPGSGKTSEVLEQPEPYVDPFATLAAQPNPANKQVSIRFSLKESSQATVQLFDLSGAAVKTVFNQDAVAGNAYQVNVDTDELPAGIYIVRIRSDKGEQLHHKLVVAH